MNKIPTGKELATLFLTGMGLLSFYVLFFWVPVISDIFLFIGATLVFISLVTFIVKLLKK